MRTLFKTDYRQDLTIWRHRGDLFWYGLLLAVVLALPHLLGVFYIGELGAVFIYAIAGVGLMLLTGYTGLVNLGHAAFLGIGAYVNAVLLTAGWPYLLTLPASALLAGLAGVAIGIPTLRMSGLYLAIATLAFGEIVSNVLEKWDSVTHGFNGLPVPTPEIFGYPIAGATAVYYVALAMLILTLWIAANILRTPFGRALMAIRDSEVSARSMGINVALYKTVAFGVSAAMAGLAGALFAQYVNYLAPNSFDVLLSVQFLTIVFVGGVGSLQGVIFGAMFVRLLPQAISMVRDDLPGNIGHLPGLDPSLFGLILVLTILFQPTGMYGGWLSLKAWFQDFPLHRAGGFRRQRAYAKSERV